MTPQDVKSIAQRYGKKAFEVGARHEAAARARAAGSGRLPGHALIEGLWLNRQAAAFGAEFEALYVCPELIYSEEWAGTAGELIGKSAETYVISEKAYEGLSREKSDRGLLSVIRVPQRRLEDIPEGEASLVLVLDGLENPGNVGTLLRAAEGAGADAAVLCNCKTSMGNPAAVRASLLAFLTLPVAEAGFEETIGFLRTRGYTLYVGKAESSVRYCDIGYASRAAVVVGHEKYGPDERWYEKSHVAVGIPMRGRIDSLNVAVAGGILLYEAAKPEWKAKPRTRL
jgi:TrmH family RNA methyltransferase